MGTLAPQSCVPTNGQSTSELHGEGQAGLAPGLLDNLCGGHAAGTTRRSRNQSGTQMGKELRPQEHIFPLPRQEPRVAVGFLNPGVCEELKTSLWDLFRVMEKF